MGIDVIKSTCYLQNILWSYAMQVIILLYASNLYNLFQDLSPRKIRIPVSGHEIVVID